MVFRVTPTIGYEHGRSKDMSYAEAFSYLLDRGSVFTSVQQAFADVVSGHYPFREVAGAYGGNYRIEVVNDPPHARKGR